MAITFGAHLGTVYDNVDASSFVFTVTTPTSGRVAFVSVTNTKLSAVADTPTVSGLGLTWVQEATVVYDAGSGTRIRCTLFSGTGSPTGTSLTVDFAGASQTACAVSLSDWNGVDTTDPTVQVQTGQGSANFIFLTLPVAPTSGAVAGGIGILANQVINEGAAYTVIGEAAGTSPPSAHESEYQLASDQSVDWAWSSTVGFAAIAWEFREAGGAAFVPFPRREMSGGHLRLGGGITE